MPAGNNVKRKSSTPKATWRPATVAGRRTARPSAGYAATKGDVLKSDAVAQIGVNSPRLVVPTASVVTS